MARATARLTLRGDVAVTVERFGLLTPVVLDEDRARELRDQLSECLNAKHARDMADRWPTPAA